MSAQSRKRHYEHAPINEAVFAVAFERDPELSLNTLEAIRDTEQGSYPNVMQALTVGNQISLGPLQVSSGVTQQITGFACQSA